MRSQNFALTRGVTRSLRTADRAHSSYGRLWAPRCGRSRRIVMSALAGRGNERFPAFPSLKAYPRAAPDARYSAPGASLPSACRSRRRRSRCRATATRQAAPARALSARQVRNLFVWLDTDVNDRQKAHGSASLQKVGCACTCPLAALSSPDELPQPLPTPCHSQGRDGPSFLHLSVPG